LAPGGQRSGVLAVLASASRLRSRIVPLRATEITDADPEDAPPERGGSRCGWRPWVEATTDPQSTARLMAAHGLGPQPPPAAHRAMPVPGHYGVRLYPQCKKCSNAQGGQMGGLRRRSTDDELADRGRAGINTNLCV
jgi:hypothetical protein